MGQKISPISFRLGYTRSWDAHWYAPRKTFAANLFQDIRVRDFILTNYKSAAVSRVIMERAADKVRVNIYTARPGVIIGRRGADIDKLRKEIQNILGQEVQLNIKEIKNPAIDAKLLAENIALQLTKRIAFRRAMKKTMQQAREAGAKGIKVYTKGRLGGSEIARKEGYHDGAVPLHTLRANVDFGFAEAHTTYGIIGVKVWVYKGDFISKPDIFGLKGGDITTLMQEDASPTTGSKKGGEYKGKRQREGSKVSTSVGQEPVGSDSRKPIIVDTLPKGDDNVTS